MGDKGPGEFVDAGALLERSSGEFWEFPVIPGREVVPYIPQLIINYVKVVEEPFSRRGDRTLLADRFGDGVVRGQEDPAVFMNARCEPASPARVLHDLLFGREAFPVLLQALCAEYLVADRVFEGCEGIDENPRKVKKIEDSVNQFHHASLRQSNVVRIISSTCLPDNRPSHRQIIFLLTFFIRPAGIQRGVSNLYSVIVSIRKNVRIKTHF